MKKIPIQEPILKLLQILSDYNFLIILNPNSKNFGIRLHRLLLKDLNEIFFSHNNKELNKFKEKLILLISESFPKINNQPDERWGEAKKYYNHAVLLIKESNYKNKPHESRTLLQKIADYEYYISRNFKTSLRNNKKILDIEKELDIGDHPDIAISLNNIGNVYSDLGDKKEALKYLTESLEIYKRLFYGDHPDIATSLNNIDKVNFKLKVQMCNLI